MHPCIIGGGGAGAGSGGGIGTAPVAAAFVAKTGDPADH